VVAVTEFVFGAVVTGGSLMIVVELGVVGSGWSLLVTGSPPFPQADATASNPRTRPTRTGRGPAEGVRHGGRGRRRSSRLDVQPISGSKLANVPTVDGTSRIGSPPRPIQHGRESDGPITPSISRSAQSRYQAPRGVV